MRHKKPHGSKVIHHVPRHLSWLAVGSFVVLLGFVSVFAYLSLTKPKKTPAELSQAGQNVLTGVSEAPKTNVKRITSNLGFGLDYDANRFTVSGMTPTDQTVHELTDSQLSTGHDYTTIKLTPKADKNKALPTELTVYANPNKDALVPQMALPENKGRSPLDVWVSVKIAEETKRGLKLQKQYKQTIGGVEYVVLDFVYDTGAKYGVRATDIQRYYLAIKDDRPYYVAMTNLTAQSQKDIVPLLEHVFQTVTYPNKSDKRTSLERHMAVLGVSYPELTVKTPAGTVDTEKLYSVVAPNQPAVVRICTLRQGDVLIHMPGGRTIQIKGVRIGEVGSGMFVSGNGYVATNGHVTRLLAADMLEAYVTYASGSTKTERAVELLGWLRDLGVITETQRAESEGLVRGGDSATAERIINALGGSFPSQTLTIDNDTYQYAVQTSNDPIRFDNQKESLIYNDTVLPAKFVASNFDENQKPGLFKNSLQAGKSDVALLKVNGTFPTVTLGDVENVAVDKTLTALGFPAFVDGALGTKEAHTVPSATSGKVLGLLLDSQFGGHGYRMMYTDVQIAPGNSGGPAFDDNGKVVGLNTYGVIGCPDGQCFGNGYVRDIDDLKKLAAANNVALDSSGSLNAEWKKGIESFRKEDYKAAAEHFDAAHKAYPANYLAVELASIAREHAPSTFAVSLDDKTDTTRAGLIPIIIGLSVMVVLCVASGVVFAVIGHRKHRLSVGVTPATAPIMTAPYTASVQVTQPVVPPPMPNTSVAPVPAQAAQPVVLPAAPPITSAPPSPVQPAAVPQPTEVPPTFPTAAPPQA